MRELGEVVVVELEEVVVVGGEGGRGGRTRWLGWLPDVDLNLLLGSVRRSVPGRRAGFFVRIFESLRGICCARV